MHVAVSGGAVPGAKMNKGTNRWAFSQRQRHHWPKQLPNARAVVERQAVVRSRSASVTSQPLGRLEMRPNDLTTRFLGARLSATGFLRRGLP